MIRRLRYRLGVRLLAPWLAAEMQHWNRIAGDQWTTRHGQTAARGHRNRMAAFFNGAMLTVHPYAGRRHTPSDQG